MADQGWGVWYRFEQKKLTNRERCGQALWMAFGGIDAMSA